MSIFHYRPSDADGLSPADRALTRFEESIDYLPRGRIKRELDSAQCDNGDCSATILYRLHGCINWVDEIDALRELIGAIQELHSD